MLLSDLAFSKFFNTLEVPLHIFHPKQSPARKELAKVTQENLSISEDLQCKELNLGQDMTWEMENNLRERGERGNTKVEWKWAGWTKRKRGLKRKGLEVALQSEKWEAIDVVGQWAVLEGRSWTLGHWCDAVRRKGLNPNGWSVWSPPQWYALQWPALSSSHLQMT